LSSEKVKKAILIFIRAVALAAGLGLLISGIGDLGLLIGEGLWLGLSKGGLAVFKIVIGAFFVVAGIKPNVAYARMGKAE
jgi:hypothetical protein